MYLSYILKKPSKLLEKQNNNISEEWTKDNINLKYKKKI